MKKILLSVISVLAFLHSNAQKTIHCEIKTSAGILEVELYPEKASQTVANFLKYVDYKLYDGTAFFRVCTPENEMDRTVRIEVVQGGEVPAQKEFAPVPIETTNQTGIRHRNGTLSMARDLPNSATSSFFICIGKQPELDFSGKRNPDGLGFAAFGKVVRGMRVVRKIQARENKDQYLIQPVKIYSVRRK